MSIRITVLDQTLPLLSLLIERHPGMAAEALQVAGAKLQHGIKAAMLSHSTDWVTIFRNGRRSTTRGTSHPIGQVYSGGNMADRLIDYWLWPSRKGVTVAGAHPTFQPRKYKLGVDVGPYGPPVRGVGPVGRSIIHKLNTGQITSEHPYSKGSWFPNAKYPHRGFVEQGASAAMPSAIAAVKSRYYQTFGEIVQAAPVKTVVRRFG